MDNRSNNELLARWTPFQDGASRWTPPTGRLVVVSPHPDDETLMCGGLIRRFRAVGDEVLVVAVTDGDAAYVAEGDPELAQRRRNEQQSALRVLGVEAAPIRLGFPDSGVAGSETRLGDELRNVIRDGDLVVAPWLHDVHPDHEATGRAVASLVGDVACTVMFAPFWFWHHTTPPATTPANLFRLELGSADVAVKRKALECHSSQFVTEGGRAILNDALIEPATWSREFYFAFDPERIDR